jgi:GRASP55/65 PDZ-like domain
VYIVVWNIKSQCARLVDIIPSDNWGGAGLLGVTIRLDNYAGAEDRLVRVLSIDSPKSPAAIAGLVPEKDFILGTTHQTLDSVDQLASVLHQYEDNIVELYVYNTEDDRVRVVALVPTKTWDGSRGGKSLTIFSSDALIFILTQCNTIKSMLLLLLFIIFSRMLCK